jgi:hypothetical protein
MRQWLMAASMSVMWIPAMVCEEQVGDHSAFKALKRALHEHEFPYVLQGKTKTGFNTVQKGSSSLWPWPAKGPVLINRQYVARASGLSGTSPACC